MAVADWNLPCLMAGALVFDCFSTDAGARSLIKSSATFTVLNSRPLDLCAVLKTTSGTQQRMSHIASIHFSAQQNVYNKQGIADC